MKVEYHYTTWSFTMADRLSRFRTLRAKSAFTMAEILISLTIIGVIAAITLPSLVGNINEKAWASQRKALYSRMSQAIELMPSLNGYGIGATDDETASKAAQAFISDGLSKVLKINNICAAPDGADATVARNEFKKCGFPEKFTKMGINSKLDTPITINDLNGYFVIPNGDNVHYSQVNTNSAAFETANGESILTFYNPNCSYTYGVNGKYNLQNLMQPTMCANFIYDLNGKKGPNKVGKDIGFMTAFYPTDSQIVAPAPLGHQRMDKDEPYPTFTISNGNAYCRSKYGDDARMANIEELKSVFTNNNLGYISSSIPYFIQQAGYRSSTLYSITKVYGIKGHSGEIGTSLPGYNTDNYARIFCVKR